MHPSELTYKQVVRLHQLLHEAKFKDPDGSHLRPAGELLVSLCWEGGLCQRAYPVWLGVPTNPLAKRLRSERLQRPACFSCSDARWKAAA